VALGLDLVAQRLEERPQQPLAAAQRQHRVGDLVRDRGVGVLGALAAAPSERRAEHAADRDAHL
jgi:hypothetical protein